MTADLSSAASGVAAHEGCDTAGAAGGPTTDTAERTAAENTGLAPGVTTVETVSTDAPVYLNEAETDLANSGPGPLISPSNTAAASWALFAGIALLMIGNGLQGSLIGVRAEFEGFSTAATGFVMACYFAGFLAGTRAATKALQSVGHIRVFAALASVASTATLVHLLAVMPVTWALMRFATGLCVAGLYVVAESWINDLATNATRGRLLAIYMVVTMGGVALGQFLLNVADPRSFELFILASVLISLSLVPMALSGRSAPPTRIPESMSLKDLAAIVPTGLVVSLLVGMGAGALMGIGPVYAASAGLSTSQIALFMGAPMVGGMALQFPIGSLSDRVSRRGVMFFVAIAATVSAAGLLFAPTASPLTYLLMFLVGGFSFPLYSLSIAYTNDWIRPEQTTPASALLVTINGLGAVIGPLLAAGLIIGLGTRWYFASLAATHGAIGIYLAWRIAFRDALPTERQGAFLPFPARASAGAVALVARRPRRRKRQEPSGGHGPYGPTS